MKCKFDKSLLPLKLVLFAYYGASASILPYLTVHMRQIGITVEETAIIYAALPFVGFLGPPVAGFFADRLGRYRPILLTSLVAVALFHTALLAIPPMSYVNEPASVQLTCDHQRTVAKVERCSQDDPCLGNISRITAQWRMDQCLTPFTCLSNDDHDNNNLFIESRTIQGTKEKGHVATWDPVSESNSDDNSSNSNPNITLVDLQLIFESGSSCHYEITAIHCDEGRTIINMTTCPSIDHTTNCTLTSTRAIIYDNINQRLPACKHFVGDHLLTFSTYFALRVVGGVFLSATFALLDATCFAMIEKTDGEYGKQKLWSILATAIFSPITGFLIDHASNTKGYVDYSPAFYVFDCLIICTVFLSLWLNIQLDNSSPEKMIKNMKKLLKRVEVIALLAMVLVLGTMWGFLETFLFWYLVDLHSPKYLLGLTVTIGSGVSIPVMFCAAKIVKKVGNITLLVCALGVYSVRMIGYSLIYNPWWCLVFESLEVLTINLMWVAAATYGNSIAPPGLTATMQGTMGGMHFGIGRGVGSFVGGFFLQHFGSRLTFRIMGVTSAVACIIALTYFVIYIRRSKQANHQKDISSSKGLKTRDDSQLQQFLKREDSNEKQSPI